MLFDLGNKSAKDYFENYGNISSIIEDLEFEYKRSQEIPVELYPKQLGRLEAVISVTIARLLSIEKAVSNL